MLSSAAVNRRALWAPTPGTVISRLQTGSASASRWTRSSAILISRERLSIARSWAARCSGRSPISLTRSAKLGVAPLEIRTAWPRSQPRTVLISFARAVTRHMHRGQIDAARDFAQGLGIPPVGFRPTRPHAQCSNQRRRHHSHLVPEGQCRICDAKRLGTGLHDHPALRPPLEKLLQGQSIRPRLVQDRPIACSDAHLGFPSSEIDRTMLHGWFLLFAANRPRVNRERRYSRQLVEKEPATSSSLQTSAKPSRRRRRLRQYSCAATLDSMTRSSTTVRKPRAGSRANGTRSSSAPGSPRHEETG